MQCYEFEIILLHLKAELGEYLAGDVNDLDRLSDVLEKLGVKNYQQLRALNRQTIRTVSNLTAPGFDRAA